LTNDIKALGKTWHFSGYCNPKGRLLAVLQLWKIDSDYYAVLDKSLADATLKRLRMYVLRSKVVIEILDHATCLASIDNTAHPLLATMQNGQASSNDQRDIMALHMGTRFMLIDLKGAVAAEPDTQWLREDINVGHPRITAASSELFIPQMLNLDLLGGISFKKGCYTGQEIVARMHYLGKLKQRQYLCQFKNTEHGAQIGDKVVLATDRSKSVGTIASAVSGFNNVLVVLRSEQIEQAVLETESGESLSVLDKQPFQLPE